MSKVSKAEVVAAKSIVGPLPEDPNWDHEHNADCKEIQTVEMIRFVTPDIDESYDREIYVCKVTGEDIDLDEADPLADRADELESIEADNWDQDR